MDIIALDYYHRMDHAYQASQPLGHLAAIVATHSPTIAKPWYSDTGATHHITSDLGNRSIHNSYHGFGTVQVGNCQGLSISNIGNTTMRTPTSTFYLCNILHIALTLLPTYCLLQNFLGTIIVFFFFFSL